MSIPLLQAYKVGRYIAGRKIRGIKRYPLVLMLEPLFQCNLACGKIDHSKEILQQRLGVEDALRAVDECGAPMVSIPGGEPLIHKGLPQIVAGIVARKKFVYLCTNAILLPKHIHEYEPSPYLTFSIHLDGKRERHDESVCQEGVYDKAVAAIRLARSKGFRQDVFLGRSASKRLFREIFKRGPRAKPGEDRPRRWSFNHSSLFLDFLAGNQSYQCTPWSTPTYNIFGWQRPCYLLTDEGYAPSFKSLMEDTAWEQYGVGRNPACDNCMAHCGYEPSAVLATSRSLRQSLRALRAA